MTRPPAVLILDEPGSASWEPWGRDVVEAVRRTHRIEAMSVGRRAYDLVADPSVEIVVDPMMRADAQFAQAAHGHIRLWQLVSVGHDALDRAALDAHGIPVARCPGSTSARSLAEHAILLMLLVLRRMSIAAPGASPPFEFGDTLTGKTLLIVGLGASGQALAIRCARLGMRVLGLRRGGARRRGRQDRCLAWIGDMDQLDEALDQADIVSLHVPLVADTTNLLDRARIARIRSGGMVINVSRGGLVDETALADAIRAGHLVGAGLDVIANEPLSESDPLLRVPNMIVTRHVAGQTYETSRRRARFVAHNVDRVLRGREPLCRIDAAPQPAI